MSVEMIPLAAIVPNKYRRIELYPWNDAKLEALAQSYKASGFWDGSIQARMHPTSPGKFEIAFGHHRVEACRRAKVDPIGLVIAPRSDADMLRMMADENRDEFRADALVAVETIAAVVGAYERGEIELEAVATDGPHSSQVILPGGKIYNLSTIARFLGWVKPSTGQATSGCQKAFDAFRMRATTEAAIHSIPADQRSEVAVTTVVTAAHAARATAEKAGLPPTKVREAEQAAASAAAADVTESSGFRARDNAVAIGKAAVDRVAKRKPKRAIDVEVYIAKLIRKCEGIDPYLQILRECRHLIPLIADLDKTQTRKLAAALRAMLTRSATGVRAVAEALDANEPKKLRKLLEAQR